MKYKFSNDIEVNRTLEQVLRQINRMADSQRSHIDSLTRIGLSLSSATNLTHIFDMILVEALSFTNADAATIYQVSDNQKFLNFEIAYNRTLNWQMGGSHSPMTLNPMPLYNEDGTPRIKNIATSVVHNKQSLCFEDVYLTPDYDVSGTKMYDQSNNYRSKSMLTIPLKNHEDEVLGVIQVINAMDMRKRVIPFTNEHITMLNSLASSAAIALSNKKLINDLESLLLDFMRAIAHGIERKSKTSANHVSRVTLLTEMIASKINLVNEGKYAAASFSPNELKEISMAGWMHDVGKIITPEHIMDKGKKLETIVDRIKLVDLRFSLFRKALTLYKCEYGETAMLNMVDSWYSDPKPQNHQELMLRLDEDQTFLRKVNTGGEFLPASDAERIAKMGDMVFAYQDETWSLLEADEIYNLQIQRGTLTKEEKKLMDDHVQVTWEILSQLTFPQKYKNVALYAASHHEKLNGKGHPFGLTAEQLPLQSRILAVADIYEALTAADRPYKKAKSLSESLKIMAFFVKDGDLDGDLLDFFMDSGLYLEFAEKYMNQTQTDEVDINGIKKIYHKDLS